MKHNKNTRRCSSFRHDILFLKHQLLYTVNTEDLTASWTENWPEWWTELWTKHIKFYFFTVLNSRSIFGPLLGQLLGPLIGPLFCPLFGPGFGPGFGPRFDPGFGPHVRPRFGPRSHMTGEQAGRRLLTNSETEGWINQHVHTNWINRSYQIVFNINIQGLSPNIFWPIVFSASRNKPYEIWPYQNGLWTSGIQSWPRKIRKNNVLK